MLRKAPARLSGHLCLADRLGIPVCSPVLPCNALLYPVPCADVLLPVLWAPWGNGVLQHLEASEGLLRSTSTQSESRVAAACCLLLLPRC